MVSLSLKLLEADYESGYFPEGLAQWSEEDARCHALVSASWRVLESASAPKPLDYPS